MACQYWSAQPEMKPPHDTKQDQPSHSSSAQCAAKNYQLNHNNEFFIDASIILTESEADGMVQKLLNDFSIQDTIVAFALPMTYAHLKPNDLIQIEYKSQSYVLEIVKIEIKNISTINIFGIQVS